MNKLKIGIIGGIGPESTVDYYKKIIEKYQSLTGSNEYPNIIINSIDMTKMLNFVKDMDFIELINYFEGELQVLYKAGVDIALIASNTPHIVFDEVREKSPIKLISIVESTLTPIIHKTNKSDYYSPNLAIL